MVRSITHIANLFILLRALAMGGNLPPHLRLKKLPVRLSGGKFMKICATMPSAQRIGSRNKNFKRFFPGKEDPETFLDFGGQGCNMVSAKSY
jgi:hypothetical protein